MKHIWTPLPAVANLNPQHLDLKPSTFNLKPSSVRAAIGIRPAMLTLTPPSRLFAEPAYSGLCRTVILISVGQGSDFCRTPFRFLSDRVPGCCRTVFGSD